MVWVRYGSRLPLSGAGYLCRLLLGEARREEFLSMSTQKLSDDEYVLALEQDPQEQIPGPLPGSTLVSPDREELVEGSRPGNKYVRVFMSPVREFRRLGPGRFEATELAALPRTPLQRKLTRAKRFLIGPPLSSERAIHERLNKIKGLAVLSSDAISSSAYEIGRA